MHKQIIEKYKKRIINSLKRNYMSATELSVLTGINYYKINNLLKELIAEKRIEVFDFKKNKYYKLGK